jgi:Trypsin-like peptidase domain
MMSKKIVVSGLATTSIVGLLALLSSPMCACGAIKQEPPGNVEAKTDRVSTNISSQAGISKKVDNIAQQITVRIDNKDGGHGSGVIIARQNDIYYVATTAHVVQNIRKSNDSNVLGEKIATVVVTPTQERIMLSAEEINVFNADLDVGVVQFRSKQNYRVAEIGNDRIKNQDWLFISGFPAKTPNKLHLSVGRGWDRKNGKLRVKHKESLMHGMELTYTNRAVMGMGGGAVLDRQGRLIGIHAGAEDEVGLGADGQMTITKFGTGLGIPISTVVKIAKENLSLGGLRVNNTPMPKLTDSKEAQLNQIQSTQKIDDYSQLIDSYSQLIKLNPLNYRAYIGRGQAYIAAGQAQPHIIALPTYWTARVDLEQAAKLLSDRQDSEEYRSVEKLLQYINLQDYN